MPDRIMNRNKLVGWLLIAALLLAGGANVISTISMFRINGIQNRQDSDAVALSVTRFRAETRTCHTSQDIVRGERRVIKRSLNANRRAGLLTRESLNFYTATLRDLKVPRCTPTLLGFPQFEPQPIDTP